MTRSLIPIHFHFLTSITLRHRNSLKNFIQLLFHQENVQLQVLNYIFCSDAYLAEINLRYLNHDTYTDIITFHLSQPNKPIIGDIYISVERVKENAIAFQTTFKEELHRVIFHGALHLCGYTDKSNKQKKLMRQKEEFYIKQYFVSRETL